VTGIIDPKNIKENRGARAGERVILTKPLGTGLITTALKRGKAAPEHVQAAVSTMLQLNRQAAEIAVELQVKVMTDVTGFGLAGHAIEVAKASRISIQFDHRNLPLLPGALEYSRLGLCAGGLTSNRDFFSKHVSFSDSVSPEMKNVFFDPQTSGGLLIFCPARDAERLLQKLQSLQVPAVEVGSTMPEQEHMLTLT
jgi:selenide,water dikinase